jgi:4-amino-4-deoxychorismate lyase
MIPSSYTAYKTTPRPHYDASRMRVGLVDEITPTEVLIWNPDRFVMEGSRTNVYFYRDGVWVTPSEETGCLRGTERRWLIEKGMINVKDLKVDEVQDGEIVLLSNGLRGIWAATIQK